MTRSPARPRRRFVPTLGTLLAVLLGCRDRGALSPEARALAARMPLATFEGAGYAYPLPYRLFVPDGYDPRRAYPLVVYLHGGGGRGADGLRHLTADVAALISDRVQALERSFVLAPQCPEGDEWVNRSDRPPFSNYDQARVPESDAARMVLEVIRIVQGRYAIDPDRIYLTGPSMGGSGTWDLVTRHPHVFAAAVPITGVNDPSRAAAIADLPIWAFHGARDEISSVDNTRVMVAALRRLGSPVRFTELDGVGHDAWTPAYGSLDTYRWLFAQRRGAGRAARR